MGVCVDKSRFIARSVDDGAARRDNSSHLDANRLPWLPSASQRRQGDCDLKPMPD